MPQLEAMGLAATDPWLLSEIKERQYPTEIVRHLLIPAPTVSQMLKRLEADGLVVRLLDPSDLRRYKFEVTEKGMAALEKSREFMLKAMEKRLERFDPQQREQFIEMLDVLTESEKTLKVKRRTLNAEH